MDIFMPTITASRSEGFPIDLDTLDIERSRQP
jgi:hypothetical protein